MKTARQEWLLWGFGTGVLFAGALVFALWTPPEGAGSSICLFRRLGGSCPGCGMTRALSLLAHGDLAGSLAVHPWGLLLALQGLLFWAGSAFLLLRAPRGGAMEPRPLHPERSRILHAVDWTYINGILIVNGVALCALWLVRLSR
jgi:hypothetical protein